MARRIHNPYFNKREDELTLMDRLGCATEVELRCGLTLQNPTCVKNSNGKISSMDDMSGGHLSLNSYRDNLTSKVDKIFDIIRIDSYEINELPEEDLGLQFFMDSVLEYGEQVELLTINENAVTPFIPTLTFPTNKIHIITGDNGRGKSSLLDNILDNLSGNVLSGCKSYGDRLLIGSNNLSIGNTFYNTGYKWYSKEPNLLERKFTNTNPLKSNIVLYTDFSTTFFNKPSDSSTLNTLIEQVDAHSNGERKITAINTITGIMMDLNDIIKKSPSGHIEIQILMDEPESGLSNMVQREFEKRVKKLYKDLNSKITLTVFIVSHSLVWKESGLIKIHDIEELKNGKDIKKKRKKVFI